MISHQSASIETISDSYLFSLQIIVPHYMGTESLKFIEWFRDLKKLKRK